MADEKSLVVKSAVGDFIRGKGLKVSGELVGGINAILKDLLARACERCSENKRKTVMVQDL
ncbi:MAG: hypothetical protein ACFFCS_27410 [Candidatus Hodarchaeota archaeon]